MVHNLRRATDEEVERLLEVKNRLVQAASQAILDGEVTATEMTCLAANLAGFCSAMIGQSEASSSEVMEAINANIVAGNKDGAAMVREQRSLN